MMKSFYKRIENDLSTANSDQHLHLSTILSPVVNCKLISLYVKLKRSSCSLIRFCLVVINIIFVFSAIRSMPVCLH